MYKIKYLMIYHSLKFIILINEENEVLLHFNSFHKKIQFTCEKELNNKIIFSAVEIIRTTNKLLVTNWYTKPINSVGTFNYNYNHAIII